MAEHNPRPSVLTHLAMVALCLVIVMWGAFVWERATGLTFATRYRLGSVSNADHLAQTRSRAIATTIAAAPLILWAWLRRK